MIIAKNDEKKRSRVWGITMIVSSLVIIMTAVYLLMKMFMANPLEGVWESEDGSLIMDIRANGKILAVISEVPVVTSSLDENVEAAVEMSSVIDRDAKTITIQAEREALEESAEKSDGAYTAEFLKSSLQYLTTTFDYSVEKEELTLTEREYGEQLTFTKQ